MSDISTGETAPRLGKLPKAKFLKYKFTVEALVWAITHAALAALAAPAAPVGECNLALF